MLIRVLNAIRPLRVEGHIGRIVVSTERPDMLDSLAAQGFAVDDVEFLKASGSPSQSVAQALETLGAPLFVTTRSEEHTSELQSLMRISYAVFCLQHKIKKTQDTKS